MKLEPVIILTKEKDVEDVYFDITLIIDKENDVQIIDNTKEDYHDFIDCNTLLLKQLKLRP